MLDKATAGFFLPIPNPVSSTIMYDTGASKIVPGHQDKMTREHQDKMAPEHQDKMTPEHQDKMAHGHQDKMAQCVFLTQLCRQIRLDMLQ